MNHFPTYYLFIFKNDHLRFNQPISFKIINVRTIVSGPKISFCTDVSLVLGCLILCRSNRFNFYFYLLFFNKNAGLVFVKSFLTEFFCPGFLSRPRFRFYFPPIRRNPRHPNAIHFLYNDPLRSINCHCTTSKIAIQLLWTPLSFFIFFFVLGKIAPFIR